MKIKDAMTKDVISVSPSAGIKEIYDILRKNNIGGAPVVDGDNKVLGMITKTELLNVLVPDYFGMLGDFLFIDDFGALEARLEFIPSLELFIAGDMMIRNAITINQSASLMKAPLLMNKYNIRRLPVVDNAKKLVGIITRTDVMSALFNGRNQA